MFLVFKCKFYHISCYYCLTCVPEQFCLSMANISIPPIAMLECYDISNLTCTGDDDNDGLDFENFSPDTLAEMDDIPALKPLLSDQNSIPLPKPRAPSSYPVNAGSYALQARLTLKTETMPGTLSFFSGQDVRTPSSPVKVAAQCVASVNDAVIPAESENTHAARTQSEGPFISDGSA